MVIQYNEISDPGLAEIRVISTLNGQQRVDDFYQVRQLEATVDFNNVGVNRLGDKSQAILMRGYSGNGNITLFDASRRLDELMMQYVSQNIPFRFDIIVTLNDPAVATQLGSKQVMLQGCVPTSYTPVSVDVDGDYAENSFAFQYERIEILKHWNFRTA